jgi:hypothetical protein
MTTSSQQLDATKNPLDDPELFIDELSERIQNATRLIAGGLTGDPAIVAAQKVRLWAALLQTALEQRTAT